MDTSASTTETKAAAIAYSEHVFGRFGQGVGADVTSNTAFTMNPQKISTSTNEVYGVMFSIFP
jgi:hypothetical protein